MYGMEQYLTGSEQGWWCLCHHGKIWLPGGQLPLGTAQQWSLGGKSARLIGEWQEAPVWLLCHQHENEMFSVRQLLNSDSGLFQLAGRAVQLAEFYRSHHFCGCCGAVMTSSQSEWARVCVACGQHCYPQIAPCIIVAIRREQEILLARHHRHQEKIYTVLAGFVEVGETLEQAVSREVMEESQLQIGNLRYVISQPWPFPHSLMVAFTADYLSGELRYNPEELLDADWFHYTRLPSLPPVGTVARQLINKVVLQCRAEYE